MTKPKFLAAGFLCLFLAGVCSTQAGTKTWTAGTGDWFVNANWGGNPYPTNGDDVVITNAGASVLLTNSTAYLGSLTLSKTLVFSNWNTTLSATNITIQSGGTVSLPAAFTDTQMSNNVCFVCSNITINASGSINVDGQGWIGRYNLDGFGPGAGKVTGGGGGHGGYGGGYVGSSNASSPCGVSSAPILPGSSGGGGNAGWGGTAGNGGGAVRITADGTVTVNGTISANGTGSGGGNSGAGSGGSIFIACGVLSGTTGVIRANGGSGSGSPLYTGGGGGGRIAIVFNTAWQAAASVPTIQYQVAGAVGGGMTPGDIGTLYFPNSRVMPENMNWSGQVVIPGFTSWAVDRFGLSNGWVRFPQDGFNLTVSNNLVLDGSSAWLQVGAAVFRIINNKNNTPLFSGGVTASVLSVGGNVTLTNGACLYLYGAQTNGGAPAFGALVSVAGDMYVGSNSWVYPQSHPTNGGSVYFQVRNLTVAGGASGGFDANGPRGFSEGIVGHLNGFGPGGGQGGAWMGGGYGGLGGGASGIYGQTYGSSNAPSDPGSGGSYDLANGTPRPGGGLVYLLASRTVTLRGILKANGTSTSWGSGAGSGGGIFIRCKTFIGSTVGSLQAKGGDVSDYSGGGGGGRIAIWRISDQSEGPVSTSVVGGANLGNNGAPGGAGTLVWGWMPVPGTVFVGR